MANEASWMVVRQKNNAGIKPRVYVRCRYPLLAVLNGQVIPCKVHHFTPMRQVKIIEARPPHWHILAVLTSMAPFQRSTAELWRWTENIWDSLSLGQRVYWTPDGLRKASRCEPQHGGLVWSKHHEATAIQSDSTSVPTNFHKLVWIGCGWRKISWQTGYSRSRFCQCTRKEKGTTTTLASRLY